ncbi:hypothetical protein MTO96_003240 [Rhipicephalus appendiculatus]
MGSPGDDSCQDNQDDEDEVPSYMQATRNARSVEVQTDADTAVCDSCQRLKEEVRKLNFTVEKLKRESTRIVPVLPAARKKFPHEVQLLTFLMKLRLNVPFRDLAYRFSIDPRTVATALNMSIKEAFLYVVKAEVELGLYLVIIGVILLQLSSRIETEVFLELALCNQIFWVAVSEAIQTLDFNECWCMTIASENSVWTATQKRVLRVNHQAAIFYACIGVVMPQMIK